MAIGRSYFEEEHERSDSVSSLVCHDGNEGVKRLLLLCKVTKKETKKRVESTKSYLLRKVV